MGLVSGKFTTCRRGVGKMLMEQGWMMGGELMELVWALRQGSGGYGRL
jgi:hypothetical protein